MHFSAQKMGFDPADFPLLLSELPQTFAYPDDFQRRYRKKPSALSVWLFAGNEHLIFIFGSFE